MLQKSEASPDNSGSEPFTPKTDLPTAVRQPPKEVKEAAVITDERKPPESESKTAELLAEMSHLQK